MKKILCTALATILVLSLTVAVLASNGLVTISVDPSISILVNGERFHPTDVNGDEVMTFTFNGTTYAPLRAMAEAFGLEVGYDAEQKMATVDRYNPLPETGVTVYEDDNVQINFLQCYMVEEWYGTEYGVQFVVENKTDVEITLQMSTVGINGFSYSVSGSENIAANSIGYANFTTDGMIPPSTATVEVMNGKIKIIDFGDMWNESYNYEASFSDVLIK